MGLLDDAIREHLELKRRRGADPAEVERAEREALGPVRRSPEPIDDPDAFERRGSRRIEVGAYDHDSEADFVDDEPGFDDEPDLDFDDEHDLDFASDGAPPPRFAYDQAADDLQDVEPEQSVGQHRLERASAGNRAPDLSFEDETSEFQIEHAPGHGRVQGPADGDEDVLEETPEFLQDAPEHDRLWFEQRPPRDFDFDR